MTEILLVLGILLKIRYSITNTLRIKLKKCILIIILKQLTFLPSFNFFQFLFNYLKMLFIIRFKVFENQSYYPYTIRLRIIILCSCKCGNTLDRLFMLEHIYIIDHFIKEIITNNLGFLSIFY